MKIFRQSTIFTIGLICGCILGCFIQGMTLKHEYVIGDIKIIDKIIDEELRKINIDDIVKVNSDDTFEDNGKTGKRSDSRFKRIYKASEKILGRIKASFSQISTFELFDSFMSGGYASNEVMYYVARDGNELIADELNRRNDNLVKLIKGSRRDVFNGGNGEIMLNPFVDMLNKSER